ncbi:Ribosome maturation factor RimM [bacterium HR41]|nr:Ribosome maturation factor RimM [bacterium HR41]
MGRKRLVSVGRVGRPHGLDGSFYVTVPDAEHLVEGAEVVIGGRARRIERRAGTEARPIVRLAGIGDRDGVHALRGEHLLVEQELGDDEWLAAELEGMAVLSDDGRNLGRVKRVLAAPTCSVLEVEGYGDLVPLLADALVGVDLDRRTITVRAAFLGGPAQR